VHTKRFFAKLGQVLHAVVPGCTDGLGTVTGHLLSGCGALKPARGPHALLRCAELYNLSKEDLPTEHQGHFQHSGTRSKEVPGGTPFSGSPSDTR
jgi:hypothetical protein